MRRELTCTADRLRLLAYARRWLYEHQLIVIRDRDLRAMILSATRQYEAALAKSLHGSIDAQVLERWRRALMAPRESGLTLQTWVWAAPAKHSTRQIEELLERIETLHELGVHRYLIDRRSAASLCAPPGIETTLQVD